MSIWHFFLKKPLNSIAIVVIILYRKVFSPTVGFLRLFPGYPQPSCVFYPTCSEYGLSCYKAYGFLRATRKTALRISRCHPGTAPSVDLP